MSPKPAPCVVRSCLTDDLAAAYRVIVVIGDQEIGAIGRGDMDAVRTLEDQQRAAHDRRDRAMEAILVHVAQHGCGS